MYIYWERSVSKRKKFRESAYPVYWVEAFNAAIQKWIPVDPIVTNTVANPAKLEPPANDADNGMSYVMAFEDHGVARDVTRRYARAFNSKTRKTRIESTPGGEKWWTGILNFYGRRVVLVSWLSLSLSPHTQMFRQLERLCGRKDRPIMANLVVLVGS